MDRDIELFLRYLEERKKFYDRRICGGYFQIDGKSVPHIKRNEVGMGQAFRLFNYYANNKTSDIDNYNMSISLIRILSVPKEEWPLHGEIFMQFDDLSMMLEESPLNIRGKLNIILRLLEKNMASVLVREDKKKVAGIDVQHIDKFEFRNMTREEFLIFIRTDEYGKISSKEESEWNEREKEQMEEFLRYFEQFPLDIQPYVDKHLVVKEHYMDKKDSYTEEDLAIFLQVLREFGTSEELIGKINSFLMKDVEKRKKQVKSDILVVSVPKEEVKPRITDKQYKLLNKELRKYFDLNSMKVVQPLNLELQIYCVSLMIKMAIDGEVIKQSLRIMNKGVIIDRNNPLCSYNELYGKLRYYENIPGIREAITNINSYIEEMFICPDEDYVIFKGMIFEEMSNIDGAIPKSYEYEFVEGMILSKK